MTQADVTKIVKEVEGDVLAIRLAEQGIFRDVLKNKSRKFRRVLWALVTIFASAAILWLCFHCLPLVLKN